MPIAWVGSHGCLAAKVPSDDGFVRRESPASGFADYVLSIRPAMHVDRYAAANPARDAANPAPGH